MNCTVTLYYIIVYIVMRYFQILSHLYHQDNGKTLHYIDSLVSLPMPIIFWNLWNRGIATWRYSTIVHWE